MITYPFTDKGVGDALVWLGGDPDDVAEALLEDGYKGVPGSECKCPVAQYLGDVIDGAADVGVFLDESHAEEDGAHARLEALADLSPAPEDDVLHVDLTAAVIVFIRRFDARKYPDLIEEPTHAG